MSSISRDERRSKEMVRTRNVRVMVLVLTLWLLARWVGSKDLQEEVTKRRRRRVTVYEERA
jgi:hypothetical protein